MLNKETYIMASESSSADAEDRRAWELIVAVIEIREAIQENTAVQQQILDRQADSE